ncbi:transcriptional regulator, LuxR family [Halopseudomonas xinjiangensis]|uniref:Transcriptional regulator, LuxR family n=1 Tax=Halopseudomonas xinjiangensis TaxID=487184 RepID=A0A1H1LH86_9GAMM|nr:LuxR C-terminal-related transcriptional regulator [Halopseudomonas xinjiangensis]SDR73893.1 transcriptional regulator, LuxR family [Halopseudomonas xinjiangensis]
MASPIPLYPGKSFRPPLPADHLPRPRLVQLLGDSALRRLILISAPAGFGKSTLAAEYCEQLPDRWRSVWLALDPRDASAGQFLRTLISGLQSVLPRLGEQQLTLLEQTHSQQPLDLESVTRALLASLAERCEATGRNAPERVVLVLDDYHLVQSQQCDRLCALLLEGLPGSFQLMLTSRKKPGWHLARLRLGNQVLELGEDHLRLGNESAAEFLRRAGVTEPDPEWARHILQRNEGWFAGLRLMAIAAEQAAGALRPLTLPKTPGPLINEYLLEEVVLRQPQQVQTFLQDAAWLDRFSAELCDSVRDSEDSAAILEHLASHRVFLVPLDPEGHWYRFHHLFSDVLRNRGAAADPKRQLRIHRRACQWFAAQGLIAEAIEHALAAERPDEAASLVQALPLDQLLAEQPVAKLLRWKAELPTVLQASSERLVLVHAWTLALACQLEDAELMLDRLSAFLPQPDAHRQEQLLALALTLKGYLARQAGKLEEAFSCLGQALDSLTDDASGSRLIAMLTLAEIDLAERRIDDARGRVRDAIALAQRTGSPLFEAQAQLMRARLQQARGLVERARGTVQAQLALIDAGDHAEDLSIRARLTMYEGYLAGLQGEREQALATLDVGIAEARRCRDIHVLLGYCMKASLLGRQRDTLGEGFDTLTEAERLMHMWDIPPVLHLGWLTVLKCDLWMSTDRRELADQWLPRLRQTYCGPAPAAPPPFYHALAAYIELVNARLLWLRGDQAGCEHALRALLATLQRAGEGLQLIIVQVHLARLLFHTNREVEAGALLRAALDMAAAQRIVDPFLSLVRQSPPGLHSALADAPASTLRDDLLAMLPAIAGPTGKPVAATLREPLSTRELDVLRCIAQGYSNQQISEALYISLHTVKSHARRINNKLGVARRTQAVAQAKALGLLG